MGRFTASTMKWVCLVLILSPSLVLGGTYTETREVVDSAGKTFECEYKVVYTAKGVVNKGKSKVVCTPNTAGKPVQQTFIIEEIGQSVTVKHTIKKGKEKITGITKEDYVPPIGILQYWYWKIKLILWVCRSVCLSSEQIKTNF